MNLSIKAGIVILCCSTCQIGFSQELPAFIEQLIAEHEATLSQRNADQAPEQLFGGTRVQASTLEIWRYEFQFETVFYVPVSPRDCCDAFSRLYDVEGNLICYPEGGITGEGDGRCPGFANSRVRGTRVYGGSQIESR